MSDPFCVLLSFHYMRQFDMSKLLDKTFGEDRDDVIVFMDSGAYSAMTQGAPVDVHDYARFLQAWRDELHLMANLDDIGHTADTFENGWTNYRTLVDDYGLDILPVMHIGEPLEGLDRYYDAGNAYIALGGLTTTPWRVGAPWLVKAFQWATGRRVVFHGFGVSSWESQRHLPWYTVDHRGWLAGAEFARINLFNGRRRRSFELTTVGPTSRSPEFNKLARSYGVDPKAARVAGVKSTAAILTLSARSVLRQDHFMRQRHGAVVHPTGAFPPGLRTFFVDNNLGHLTVARNALKGWTP